MQHIMLSADKEQIQSVSALLGGRLHTYAPGNLLPMEPGLTTSTAAVR